ncbi:hypothetical protein KUV65_04615 [Maritalea mobilis]|uniref:hypothetical protein n=1 Tax=Maritalea mobilis TaxID=483324 RepID=UPI001C94BF0B|nr:hypothetical protein [Maritalea mobilis]MBY6200633.1 hypothetical protein [Maritalea mobilis]
MGRQLLAVALVVLSGTGMAAAQMGHGGGMHRHGAGGMMAHDEVTMPGLRGLDATPEESAEMAVLFRNFQSLSREVETLPNGIRTVTRAADPEVMDVLVRHVVGMIARVDEGRDPQVFIQSPTLDIFFARPEVIETEIEITEAGIVVTQTSTDPEMVAALHIHAVEVTDMVDRGMAAVHDRMMRQQGN